MLCLQLLPAGYWSVLILCSAVWGCLGIYFLDSVPFCTEYHNRISTANICYTIRRGIIGLRSSIVTEAVILLLTCGPDGTEAHMLVTKSPWSGLQRSFSRIIRAALLEKFHAWSALHLLLVIFLPPSSWLFNLQPFVLSQCTLLCLLFGNKIQATQGFCRSFFQKRKERNSINPLWCHLFLLHMSHGDQLGQAPKAVHKN